MKSCRFLTRIFPLFFFVLASRVYAFDLSVVGAMTISNYSLTPSQSTSSGVSFGTGATAGFDLNPFFRLEAGVLFLAHSFSTAVGSSTSNYSYNYMDLPAILWFTPFSVISVGAGPYYGISTASSVVTSVLPVPSVSKVNDFGFLAGVGARFPLIPLFKLRVDVLYQYGLLNLSSDAALTQYSRNLDFLVGLMLDF